MSLGWTASFLSKFSASHPAWVLPAHRLHPGKANLLLFMLCAGKTKKIATIKTGITQALCHKDELRQDSADKCNIENVKTFSYKRLSFFLLDCHPKVFQPLHANMLTHAPPDLSKHVSLSIFGSQKKGTLFHAYAVHFHVMFIKMVYP